MSASDIVITSDYGTKRPKKRKRAREQQTPQPQIQAGVLVIPASAPDDTDHHRVEEKANVIVVASINIKATRQAIINDWRRYTPEAIVAVYRKYYTGDDKRGVFTAIIKDGDTERRVKISRSLTTMLSRLKTFLSKLRPPPPAEYLQVSLYRRLNISSSGERTMRNANVVL